MQMRKKDVKKINSSFRFDNWGSAGLLWLSALGFVPAWAEEEQASRFDLTQKAKEAPLPLHHDLQTNRNQFAEILSKAKGNLIQGREDLTKDQKQALVQAFENYQKALDGSLQPSPNQKTKNETDKFPNQDALVAYYYKELIEKLNHPALSKETDDGKAKIKSDELRNSAKEYKKSLDGQHSELDLALAYKKLSTRFLQQIQNSSDKDTAYAKVAGKYDSLVEDYLNSVQDNKAEEIKEKKFQELLKKHVELVQAYDGLFLSQSNPSVNRNCSDCQTARKSLEPTPGQIPELSKTLQQVDQRLTQSQSQSQSLTQSQSGGSGPSDVKLEKSGSIASRSGSDPGEKQSLNSSVAKTLARSSSVSGEGRLSPVEGPGSNPGKPDPRILTGGTPSEKSSSLQGQERDGETPSVAAVQTPERGESSTGSLRGRGSKGNRLSIVIPENTPWDSDSVNFGSLKPGLGQGFGSVKLNSKNTQNFNLTPSASLSRLGKSESKPSIESKEGDGASPTRSKQVTSSSDLALKNFPIQTLQSPSSSGSSPQVADSLVRMVEETDSEKSPSGPPSPPPLSPTQSLVESARRSESDLLREGSRLERLESPKSLKLSSHGGSLSAARPPELAQSSLIGEGQSALVEKISSESVRESSGLVEKANRLVDEKIENDRKKREESEWDKKKRSLILRKMDLFFRGLDSIYMNGRYDLEISLFGEKHREIIQRYKEHFEKAKNTAEFSELEKSDPSERLKKEFKNFLVSSTVKQQLKKKNEIKKQIEMSDNFLKSDFFSKASSQVLGFHRSDLVDAEKIVLDLKEKNQDLVLDEGEMKDLRGLIQLMDKVIPLKKELENRKRQIVLLSGQASIAQEHFRSISNNPSYKTEHDQLKKGFSDLSTAQNEVLQMLDQLKVQSRDLNVDPSTFDNKKLEVEKKLKQFLSQVESLAKQIEDLQLGRFEGGFKEFIFGKVAQTPYVFRGNSACKGVISDLAGLADAGKKLNRESSFSGFSDEVSRVQCSITNQGSEFEINFQLKSKVGNRSSVSDLSASVFCFNYEKYIIPKTIKTNGVTCDLAIAHATMKDVYHVFGLSDQSKVFLHKRNEGALALDHQNEVSGRSKRKMENEFTKNSWQLQAESSLEKRVFDQKLYGDLILKEPVYSEMINDKDQKSFQNGLQDFGGFSLQQRLDHLVSGNGTENKKLLNDMSRMKSCAQDLISQVEKMHDLGIFHRDIKPANILVDNRGRCRVIDFGSAVWVRPDENGKRYLVFNGYNHTQEYLRWFDSKNDALGGSPKLSSEDRDFKAYEEFERKVMEVTQGRGIEMKEGEAPIDAMVRFARENPRFELPSLEVDQIKKFTGGENDRAQLGAVLSMLLLDKTQLYGSPRQLVLNLLTGLRAGGASQSKKIEKKKELLSRFQQSQFGSASKDEGLKKLQSKAIDHLRYYYESLTDQPVPDTEDRQIKKSTSPEKVQQKARLIQKRQGLARNNLERMNQRQVKRAQVRPGLGGGR